MSFVVDGLGGTSSGRHASPPSGFAGAVKAATETVVRGADAARKAASTSHISADAAERQAKAKSHSSRSGSISADAAERRAKAETASTTTYSSRAGSVSADAAERRAAQSAPQSSGEACTFVPAAPQTLVVQPGDTVWEYWQDHGAGTEWQPYKGDFNARNVDILQDGWLHPQEIAVLPPAPGDGTWECPPLPAPDPERSGGPDSPAFEPHPQPPRVAQELPSGLPPYMYPDWTPPPPALPPGLPPYMYPGWKPAPEVETIPFPVGPMSSPERRTAYGMQALSLGQQVNALFPTLLTSDSSRGIIDAMFTSDRGQQSGLKIFTSTYAPINPVGGNYATGGASLKLHGWFAERTDVALSPSWITADGTRMRSGTFSMTVGVQFEAIGEANAPQGDVRAFATLNEAKVVSYTITTTEDRLHDIMTGEVAAPNPISLDNMLPGDSVTISTGPTRTAEGELRVLAGKSAGRAGLDVKLDAWTAESEKFTVKMVANDKVPGEKHVIILDGNRQGSGSAVGFGLIWNPKLGTTPDGQKGTGPLDSYSDGMFGRVLLQSRQSSEHEAYNFIELNPFDTSQGGGRALYDEIINTGIVSYDETSNSVPGALAIGTMTMDADNASATLQLTGYTDVKEGSGGPKQYLAQYSLDLLTMIDQETRTHIIQGSPEATIGLTGDTKVAIRYSEGGFTNYFHEYTTNIANYTSEEMFVLTAEGVKKDQMIDALRDGAIEHITLHTAEGKELKGQDAVTWMRTHEDGWVGSNDEVHVVVDMGTRANADDFSKTFIADQKKFHDDQQDGFWENIFYEIGQNEWESPEMAIATLAAPDIFSTPDMRSNLEDHQNAQSANENFMAMSGSGMGNLLSSMNHYWQHAGTAAPYPISVDIYVDWKP